MKIAIRPELNQFIRDQVSTGHYTSESDLINEAVDALRREREAEASPAYIAYVRRSLAEAEADVAAGRVAVADADRTLSEARRRFPRGTDAQGTPH